MTKKKKKNYVRHIGSLINWLVFFSFYIFVDEVFHRAYVHCAVLWGCLCSLTHCRHPVGVPGPLWDISDWRVLSHADSSHTRVTLTSSLNKLGMGFACGKIVQVFPARQSVFLHAEIALLRPGEGWVLLGGLPECVCVQRVMMALKFPGFVLPYDLICVTAPQCPVLMGTWSCLCAQAVKPSFDYLCVFRTLCAWYEQVCPTPGILANFQLG